MNAHEYLEQLKLELEEVKYGALKRINCRRGTPEAHNSYNAGYDQGLFETVTMTLVRLGMLRNVLNE